MIAEPIA